MIPRYAHPDAAAIWSDRARWAAALRVELAVLDAQAARGEVPASAASAVRSRARIDLDRIEALEATLDHDLLAFVTAVAESVGEEGRYLHFGLTSSDVVDTALALQLRAAGDLILASFDRLVATIVRRAREERDTPMIGRTHNVHAEPMTFGAKLAGWAFEADRERRRLAAAFDDASTGKISGPVGTYSQIDPAVEAAALAALGLHVDAVSTQIVQRDRHAALVATIAVAGGSLERFATEIRNLQHTEIDELREPFRTGQAGSSAMPQKRNPIKSERVSGMARLLRGYAVAAMENQALWHERDISHSSVERVILPDATILLHFMAESLCSVIDGMEVRRASMLRNLRGGLGLHAASRLLLALVEAGVQREVAHAAVQRAATIARDENRPLRDVAVAETEIGGRIGAAGIDAAFDEAAALDNCGLLVDRLSAIDAG